ncbi:mitochondrial carrier domain-containing protein, partial [Baffinella frigidus]
MPRRWTTRLLLLAAFVASADAIPQRGRRAAVSKLEERNQGGKAPKSAGSQVITLDWLVRNALAGAIAGTVLEVTFRVMLYPMESFKTQIQTRQRPKSLLGLVNGLVGSAAGMFPSGFLFFFAYEPIKLLLSRMDPAAAPSGVSLLALRMGSASLAMCVCGVMQIPSDVVKTRVQSGVCETTMQGFKQLWREGRGMRGLYIGAGAWLALHVPRVALTYVLYEYMRSQYLAAIYPRVDMHHWESSAVGMTCGAIHGFILSPVDLVRTRLMVAGLPEMHGGGGCERRRSGWEELVKIVTQEGAGSLLLGAPHRVVWMALRGAVFFGTLEAAKALLFFNASGGTQHAGNSDVGTQRGGAAKGPQTGHRPPLEARG